MKKVLSIILLVFAVALSASAKGETATAVFTLQPKMTCQNCENKIRTNMRYESGVTNIVTDLKAQTVTITYKPEKTSVEKLTAAFKKMGYTATIATSATSCKGMVGACQGCDQHK